MNIVEKLNLPPYESFEFEDAHAYNYWRDYYGALEIAKEYCGLKPITKFKDFSWYHGAFPPGYNSLSILTNNLYDKNKTYFVTDKNQEDVLIKNGYVKTFKIGLPFIYVDVPKLERIKDSLLIMPSHSLVGSKSENMYNKGVFLDQILNHHKFDNNKVLACLHSNDIKNGFWVRELKERGIEYIEGARTNDRNAYKRQASLFTQFEYMATNDFGSHVMYASYLGVRVSILNFPIELKEIEEEVNERILPESGLSLKELELVKMERLKPFYVEIRKATENIEFGKSYIGYEHKISPRTMKKYFGSSLVGKIFWLKLSLKDKLHRSKLLLIRR